MDSIKWGFYTRVVITVLVILPIPRISRIQRYMCKTCGCTYSELPEGVLPRRKYTIEYIEFTLILEYFGKSLRLYNGEKLGFKVCSQMLPWRIIKDYGEKAKEVLKKRIVFSGIMCVDEKWFKCDGEWYYGILAMDAISYAIIWVDVLYTKTKRKNRWKKRAVKRFLAQVKKLGYEPVVIVSDMDPAYPRAIKRVFPGCRHQWCLKHVEKAVYRAFRKAYGKHLPDGAECLKEWLLWIVFETKSEERARLFDNIPKEIMEYAREEVASLVSRLRLNTHRLFVWREELGVPMTNNPPEYTFADVRPLYLPKKSFRSPEGVKNWYYGFAVWRNHAPYVRGNRAGMSPLGHGNVNDWFKALELPALY